MILQYQHSTCVRPFIPIVTHTWCVGQVPGVEEAHADAARTECSTKAYSTCLRPTCVLLTTPAMRRYQVWRKRMLTQRRAAHKFVRRLVFLLVPLGLGAAAIRSQGPQLRESLSSLQVLHLGKLAVLVL